MKFKKLTIHNLASIEDAVIDFENGPLAEDSRFLICGPTGAGKTTILDAICLALYSTTPRLNIKKVEGYVDLYENFTLGKDRSDIKIDDTRMLMRRGSLSSFVELIFTDKDGRSLKAVWRCNRAHNRPDGNIKSPEWNLFDAASDTLISSKKPEILKEITRCIGLSFEQFCRTTMLAQGDFTKFLKSDEGEKSQILEKLTGTDIYSEISMRIHQIRAEKELACQQIASKMEGVQLLTDDERSELVEQVNSLEAGIARLKSEESKLTTNYQWKSQLDAFVKQLDEASRCLQLQREKEQTTEFQQERIVLEDWNRTSVQREWWKNMHQASRVLNDRQKELTTLQTTYSQLQAGYLALRQKLTDKQQIQQKIANYLQAEAPREKCYKDITLIVSLATQLKNLGKQIEALKQSALLLQKDSEKLQKDYTDQSEHVKKQEELLQQKIQEIRAVQTQIESLNYEHLLLQRKQLEKESVDLKEYRRLLDMVQQTKEDYQSKVKTSEESDRAVTYYMQELPRMEKWVAELTQQLRLQEEIYDKQQRACGDLMKEYRSLLNEGDTCPLCGQPIVHLASDEHFVSILKPVKEVLESLQTQLKEAATKLSEIKAQLSVSQRDAQRKHQELSVARQSLDNLLEQQQKHCLYTRYQSTEIPQQEIDATVASLTLQLQQLDKQLQIVGECQTRLTSLQKDKDNVEKIARKAEADRQVIEKKQTRTQESAIANQHLLANTQETYRSTEEQLALYIDRKLYAAEGDTYINSLKVGAERYQIANDKALAVEKHMQEIRTELQHVQGAKRIIDEQFPAWAQATVGCPVMVEQLLSQWTDLQARVGMNQEARQQAEKQYQEADDVLQAYFRDRNAVDKDRLEWLAQLSVTAIEELRVKHQQERDDMVRLISQKETVEMNLALHRNARPDGIEEDVALASLTEAVQMKKNELNEQNQLLGKLTQRLDIDKQNRQNYAAIGKQLEKATEDMNRWGHLHKLFGSNDGKKFRNIAQSYVLEQLLTNANQYLRQFTHRYEMECQPGSLTILLKDNEAGGILRPTTTISGGESFLISLSLALGLSSLSRSSFSMDTLFIDEGFGTLDGTYLSCVMDALERLHEIGGKKIGIISHVESLKERLTTQIQVSRVNATLSKVDVVSLI